MGLFGLYFFQNSLLHNNLFIMFVLNFISLFRHKYGHSKGHNYEFIRLVLHMSHQFHDKYVQSHFGKLLFHFLGQISYVSMIYFILNPYQC